jgi:adenylate cyclase
MIKPFLARLREGYRLPPRVQAIIDAQLQRADIVATWVGLSVALFLSTLYLVTPRPLGSEMTLEPVPIVAALYLCVGLVRLKLVYRGALSRLTASIFVSTDVALLYALIWSFHLQYGQPAAFYLKAPTFAFIFLIIAARALRFDPISVVMAGVSATIGWIVLVIYALYETGEGGRTKDFIVYITDNKVMIGAEVEKIIAIILVTTVLTLAIIRGRRQLVLAAASATASRDLSKFFAPEIATHIAASEQEVEAGFAETRRAAMIVSDIRGFTALAMRLPPQEVIKVLVDYQHRMSQILVRHGGTIDKFLGDGILATFGCVRPSETPAADAMRALMALMHEAESLRLSSAQQSCGSLSLGFSVSYGDVLFGAVGDGERLEFTVIGEAVNLAVKLEKENKPLGTVALVHLSAYEAACAQGFKPDPAIVHHVQNVRVQGVEHPLPALAWNYPSA